jgi:hypothetical protein
MFADEYMRLGGHIAAGAGFIQNLALIQETGYFEKSVEIAFNSFMVACDRRAILPILAISYLDLTQKE